MAIAVEEAQRLVLEAATGLRLEAEPVPLRAALGRTLAQPVRATVDVPAFANSAMDGFAVRAAEVVGAAPERPVELPVGGESRAGTPARRPLEPGVAIRISTGAALPEGADAVVRVEDTDSADGSVRVLAAVEPGGNVRRPGEDMRAGEEVLGAGAVLGAAELGVLATLGSAEVPCVRRPDLGVLSTGDELVDPGGSLGPGQIYNSNAFTIPAQAAAAGARVAAVERVRDDAAATAAAVGRGLARELLVICGGVSVGEHDHVKPVLREHGVEERFWGVTLRPGSPTWFGVSTVGQRLTLVFGLPGNPVSAMVTFHLFVRPALLAIQGRAEPDLATTAVFDEPYAKRPGRTHAVRCRLRLAADGWHATPTGPQGSHVLTSMLGADALAILPAESADVEPGERVTVTLLR